MPFYSGCNFSPRSKSRVMTAIAVIAAFMIPPTENAMGQLPAKNESIRYLALGDSYTIGESVAEKDRWPVQLAAKLKDEGYKIEALKIIATTGWRTDDLSRAIASAGISKDYNLVSLLIGVNNQYQGRSAESYAPEFEELLNTAIAYAGGDKSKVFVVSIPDYGYTPFGKDRQAAISKAIDEFNTVNKTIAEKLGVLYIDITPISREGFSDPGLVASDGLHPSGKMYGEWVEVIMKKLGF
jgi:lysophospholipase L1-like esterase